jgi:hypothetical protein
VRWWKKVHLNLERTLSETRLAPAALRIEGKPARAVPAHARKRRARKQEADVIKNRQILARPATIPRARAAETEQKAISYQYSISIISIIQGEEAPRPHFRMS